MKADVSLIPFLKAHASPVLNIERRALKRNVSVLYFPYKAHSQLAQK
jgi:hypothetical protein